MSELQISLLGIGIAVVLAMYAYNAWQHRQYRRKFGAAFKPEREDALYQSSPEKSVTDDSAPDTPATEASIGELLAEPAGNTLAETMEQVSSGEALPGETQPRESQRTHAVDGVCMLLDEATDYIAVLSLKFPAGAQALGPLWQQRFDFGKNVHACGLNMMSGAWEKVIAESPLSYSAFKLSLQLADRTGAVSEGRLGDFRDLARNIAKQLGAEVELPDVAAASARAQELDVFCAEVDQMIGLNILPSGERQLSGADVARVAALHGFSLQADGAFHLLDESGHTRFSLANYDNSPFQHHTLNQMRITGLTSLLDVPRVEQPAHCFDEMALLTRQVAMDLHAAVVDDHRVALGEASIAKIREQVAAIESRMLSGKITPGSAQARRLFS